MIDNNIQITAVYKIELTNYFYTYYKNVKIRKRYINNK